MLAIRNVPGLVLAAWLASCATDPAADGVSAVQFQDVVVPSGLRLRNEAHESYSREEASWRQAHYVYVGQTDIATAAAYVRERMPQHSWSKVRDEDNKESGLQLGFERNIYRANYTFTRGDGTTIMIVDYTTVFATDASRR